MLYQVYGKFMKVFFHVSREISYFILIADIYGPVFSFLSLRAKWTVANSPLSITQNINKQKTEETHMHTHICFSQAQTPPPDSNYKHPSI